MKCCLCAEVCLVLRRQAWRGERAPEEMYGLESAMVHVHLRFAPCVRQIDFHERLKAVSSPWSRRTDFIPWLIVYFGVLSYQQANEFREALHLNAVASREALEQELEAKHADAVSRTKGVLIAEGG